VIAHHIETRENYANFAFEFHLSRTDLGSVSSTPFPDKEQLGRAGENIFDSNVVGRVAREPGISVC